MNSICKIIIPIYRKTLSDFENISLRRTCEVLKEYDLVVIKPVSLDLSDLLSDFPCLREEAFPDPYFKSISGYNQLMLSADFYRRFSDAEYVLIVQLDAFIFRDEVREWCEKGYDYVGAPWLVRPIYKFPLLRFCSFVKSRFCSLFGLPNSQITHFKVGNGGLSLRKVSSHVRVLTDLEKVRDYYLTRKNNHIFNEDVFFSCEVNRHGANFTYPDCMEALRFSFDKYPDLCFSLNEQRLPMGCHSWYKRRMKDFWLPVIVDRKLPAGCCEELEGWI